jgi:hypothetical protein
MTVGLRDWEQAASGVRFRWTTGRASFFIPSDATAITLPLRAYFPGPDGAPVEVQVSVDDRRLADLQLRDAGVWVRPTLPLGKRPTSRRFRRIDLRVNRTVGESVLGVQLGVVEIS